MWNFKTTKKADFTLDWILPDLISLHDSLFVTLQTGSQTLFIQTHSFLILKEKQIIIFIV